MKTNRNKLICVVGATASGKTGLGVELAKRLNGEIISADSRQVYRGLDIGTGKEGRPAETALISNSKFLISNKNHNTIVRNLKLDIRNLKRHCRFINDVPQWLIDICEPEERFTMFDWLELAKIVIDDIWKRGKVPIVVGGTGLYVKALIQGFNIKKPEIGMSKSERRQKFKNDCHSRLDLETTLVNSHFRVNGQSYSREELDSFDLGKLQAVASKLSPDNYKIETLDKNNPRRLIRFIEKTQKGEVAKKSDPSLDYLLLGLDFPREILYQRIDGRDEARFKEGMLEEVEKLLKKGVSPDWMHSLGLEYRIISEFILSLKEQSGKSRQISEIFETREFEEMKQRLKFAIHQYARRQLTWWRRFEVRWLETTEQAVSASQEFLKGS